MRKLILLSISVLLALGMAGAASAAPLNWEGASLLLLGDFDPTDIPGGGVATVNGSGGIGGAIDTLRFAASRGNAQTDFTQLVTDPDSDIALIQFFDVQQGTGTFGPGIAGAVKSTFFPGGAPGVLGPGLGTLPLSGVVRLCLNINCNNAFTLNLSTPTEFGVAAVGVGGEIGGGSLLVGVSVQGAPWTVKTVTLIDEITTVFDVNKTLIFVTFKGFAHGPNSATTGSTAQPGGVLQLVTPSQVVSTILSGSNKKIASGNIFLIKFIPEPGLLLLLGSGVIGLVVLGRTRMHK